MTDFDQNIRLIAIDLDGTLYNSDKSISAGNIRAIEKAVNSGLKIILASGRPPFGILPTIRHLNLDGYLIAYNGSMLIEVDSGKVLLDRRLYPQDTHQAIKIIRKYDLYVSLHTGMNYYAEKFCPEYEWESGVFSKSPELVNDLIKDAPAQPNKLEITSLNNPKQLERLWLELQRVMPHIYLHYYPGLYVEILHQGATKQTALALACGLQGIHPRQVAAIGNAMNDLGMLGFAGISIAVDNAEEYLKQISDWQVASNDDDGVAEAIERILNNHRIDRLTATQNESPCPSEQIESQLQ